MDENYGTWFAVVSKYDDDFGSGVDVIVYDTLPRAKREQEMFGGRVIEVRTAEFACITPEEWRISIARQVRHMLEEIDPNTVGPIDLRKE